jgi:protein-S-isoprenylcysteine O-methyltransferase Ste14
MALGVGTLWSLALLPVVLAGIHYDVIPQEERHLQARFGAEYRSYCKRVRRWL